jgi:hypothetical protein
MDNGFGDVNNVQFSGFWVFHDQLYAAVSRNAGTGPNQLWRSTDGQRWEQITDFSPSPLVGAIDSFGDSGGDSPMYFYAGTSTGTGGTAMLYRSTDGKKWTQINRSDTGWVGTGNSAVTPGLLVNDGYLYAGTLNQGGGQVWRRRVDDSAPWAKVFDTATTVDRGNTLTSYLYVFNGVLYATFGSGVNLGASNISPMHVYTSRNGDPGTWVRNEGVGDGFGSRNNDVIAAFLEFGGWLYASTHNPVTGGELWRSQDGQQWAKVVDGGFGHAENIELSFLQKHQNQLWTSPRAARGQLPQVWKSSDGVNFVQSNVDGMGDPDNVNTLQGQATQTATIGFGRYVYWGGVNLVHGAQLWRVDATPTESSPTPAPSPSPDPGTNPCMRPSAPSGLALSAGRQMLTLAWTAGDGAASYVVEMGSAPGVSDVATIDTGNALTTWTGRLLPGARFVRVRAQNACGQSEPSNEVRVPAP